MALEVKVPSVGESVKEAVLAQWFKADGDTVHKDEPLFVLETIASGRDHRPCERRQENPEPVCQSAV